MIWRIRSRSRTICLSLAVVTASLYLLLLLASHSVDLQPCDALLPSKTHVLQDLAHKNLSPAGVKHPVDTVHGNSSNRDTSSEVRGHADQARKSVESGLTKLEALFGHPLYNLPCPPIPEEDLLLKVRPQVEASETNSQIWSVEQKRTWTWKEIHTIPISVRTGSLTSSQLQLPRQ